MCIKHPNVNLSLVVSWVVGLRVSVENIIMNVHHKVTSLPHICRECLNVFSLLPISHAVCIHYFLCQLYIWFSTMKVSALRSGCHSHSCIHYAQQYTCHANHLPRNFSKSYTRILNIQLKLLTSSCQSAVDWNWGNFFCLSPFLNKQLYYIVSLLWELFFMMFAFYLTQKLVLCMKAASVTFNLYIFSLLNDM